MKRFLYYVIVIPVSILVVAFAVANHQLVPVSFNPLNPGDPSLAVNLPLYAILFAVLIIGVLLGGITMWFRQGRHRRAARIARGEAERHKNEADRLRSQSGASSASRDNHAGLPTTVPF